MFPGRYFRQTLVTTAHHGNGGGVGEEPGQLDHRGRDRHPAARDPPRRPVAPADRRSRLQRLERRRARRHGGRQAPGRRDGAADRHARMAGRCRRGLGAGRRDLAATTSPASIRRPATPSSSTPAGASTGTTPRPTSPASRGPAATWRAGSSRRASRSRAATPGATGRSPPRTRSGRSRCRRSSTSTTASSSSRTSTSRALAAAGVREFALILTHPKLRGATGAWTSPIALV